MIRSNCLLSFLITKQKLKNKIWLYLGLLCIVVAILFNKSIIEHLLSPDGDISSETIRYTIIMTQFIVAIMGIYLLVTRPYISILSIRRFVVNASISAISLCLSLIVGEMILRSVLPSDPHIGREYRYPHPDLGWALEPGAQYTRRMRESVVRIKHNSEGWRDIEHSISKPNGVFRILILGDSFIEARTVNSEHTLARQLEALSWTNGHDVEVMSMGISGFNTLQEYLSFELFGQQYNPDLVLLAFFAVNDVQDNSREMKEKGARPFLDPDRPEEWEIIPMDYKRNVRRYENRSSFMGRAINRINRLMITQQFKKLAKLFRLRSMDIDRTPSLEHSNRTPSLGHSHCIETPEYTRAWITTTRILERLNGRVNKIGARLVVFTVPGNGEVVPETMSRRLALKTDPQLYCLEEAPANKRLHQILSERNITLIDLLPNFRKANREDGLQLYPIDDDHWNAKGYELAAKIIFSELETLKLLDK